MISSVPAAAISNRLSRAPAVVRTCEWDYGIGADGGVSMGMLPPASRR
jgi:hypothetical protein